MIETVLDSRARFRLYALLAFLRYATSSATCCSAFARQRHFCPSLSRQALAVYGVWVALPFFTISGACIEHRDTPIADRRCIACEKFECELTEYSLIH